MYFLTGPYNYCSTFWNWGSESLSAQNLAVNRAGFLMSPTPEVSFHLLPELSKMYDCLYFTHRSSPFISRESKWKTIVREMQERLWGFTCIQLKNLTVCRDLIRCLHKGQADISVFPDGLMLVAGLVCFMLCACRLVQEIDEYEGVQVYQLSSCVHLLWIKLGWACCQWRHWIFCFLILKKAWSGLKLFNSHKGWGILLDSHLWNGLRWSYSYLLDQ